MNKQVDMIPGEATHEHREFVSPKMEMGDRATPVPCGDYSKVSVQIWGDLFDAVVALEGRLHKDAPFVLLVSTGNMKSLTYLVASEISLSIVGGTEKTRVNVALLLKR